MRKFPKLSFNVVLLLIAIVIAIALPTWKAIQGTGEIRGSVRSAAGDPVAGAEVRIREKTLNLIKDANVVRTEQDGSFRFTDMEMIEFIINATHSNGTGSEERRYHLYFPGQDFELPEPLILEPNALTESE